MATVSSIEDILLTSLRHLHQKKDEEQLKIDLWCHFGKVFVHNVDEGTLAEGGQGKALTYFRSIQLLQIYRYQCTVSKEPSYIQDLVY